MEHPPFSPFLEVLVCGVARAGKVRAESESCGVGGSWGVHFGEFGEFWGGWGILGPILGSLGRAQSGP